MTDAAKTEYSPRTVSPPGATLAETLEELGMTQADLARRMGRPMKTINEIVRGKAMILPDTALQLERVTGVPGSFWLAREAAYRTHLAREARLAEERTGDVVAWVRQFPCKAMAGWGWIPHHERSAQYATDLLAFFRVASPHAWNLTWGRPEVAFRRSATKDGDRFAIAAWLRRGEIQAQARVVQPYSHDRFRESLEQLRALTATTPEVFVPSLQQSCAAAGVVLEFVPELPGARVSGATRWLHPSRALIQLCLRFKTDDQLWFSFFHEAAHVLLHPKKGIFIDEVNGGSSPLEVEANRFAAQALIDNHAFDAFAATRPFSRERVAAFASAQGVAPGIVVGRLQHEQLIPYSHLNDLKQRLAWTRPAAQPGR